jgi:L-arabinose isomerase
MDVPMLLWSLPYLDRDIPMPSPMSGLTGSGSNLRRLGKRFAYVVGRVGAGTVGQVVCAARAGAAARALRRARFGVVGYPCPGMLDVGVDEGELQKALGATAVHLDLDGLLRAARGASEDQTARAVERLISATGGRGEASEHALRDNLRLYVGLKELVEKNTLAGYCVRCWPELRDQHGITPCAAHALMARDGIPSTCEVDLPALITTWLLARLAGTPAFNFDITGYLEDEGAIQFAHCGAADPALAGEAGKARLRAHMRTGTGLTVEFPFQEGTVTLAKLLRPHDGRLRLFAARGEVIATGGDVRGSVATVRPEPSAAAFLSAMMREAVEHHVALVYGDWEKDLELFCEFTGVEYLPLAHHQPDWRMQ